ncbi:hypothetical protein [Asaia prunellae]|uniref:hypothetical protein n=1 Tax=Asaia prunellae TaxID=610245 RepID=UPI00131EFB63|nr:hypothetical protein [Asaia prunellae]
MNLVHNPVHARTPCLHDTATRITLHEGAGSIHIPESDNRGLTRLVRILVNM